MTKAGTTPSVEKGVGKGQKNSSLWILSDVNITRCRKTAIIQFSLMLISSDAEKQIPLNFVRCYQHQMQKTGNIEFYLMLISSDAVKRDIMKFCLMLISDAVNICH